VDAPVDAPAAADGADDRTGPRPPVPPRTMGPGERTDRIATRTRQRHTEVHALLAEGLGFRAIGARLGLARGTVRRFARADTVDELLVNNGTGRRPSLLEPFTPYLHQRFNDGVTTATRLHGEITARGFRGSYELVRDYLRPFRTTGHAVPPPPAPPTVRRAAGWIMTDPQNMDPDDQQLLDRILASSPHLAALAAYVRSFATMMCQLRGHELEAWLAAVDADDLPALRSFTLGIRRDQDAVTAGLTLPWNSGRVEGHVNRIKMLKRQMFGRAKPDLLRKRILLSD
jgi:Transposase